MTQRATPAPGPWWGNASCGACIAFVILCVGWHAGRVHFFAGDDLPWIRQASEGLSRVWLRPSPFNNFRPVFGSWLFVLDRLGIHSPKALAFSTILPNLTVVWAAWWALRSAVSSEIALLASTILLVHPARQQHLFWITAQADTIGLALALLCVGLTFRLYTNGAPRSPTLICLGIATGPSVLAKETGLILPVLVTALPGARSLSKRLLAGTAALCGSAAALGLAFLVLRGTGRAGGLVLQSGSRAFLAYPSRLLWPGDFGTWLMNAKLQADYSALVIVALVTLVVCSLALVLIRKRRHEAWVRTGLILIACGGIAYFVQQRDRSIGLGCAGFSLLCAGLLAHHSVKRLAPLAPMLLALVWSPLWLTAERRWVEATHDALQLAHAVERWRQDVGPEPLLVAVGGFVMLADSAKVPWVFELDARSLDILGVEGSPPLMAASASPATQDGRVRIQSEGSSYFGWPCVPDPGMGIVSVEYDRGGYARAATLDLGKFRSMASSRGYPAFDARLWNGTEFSPLAFSPAFGPDLIRSRSHARLRSATLQ